MQQKAVAHIAAMSLVHPYTAAAVTACRRVLSNMQSTPSDIQQRSMGALIDRLPDAADKGHLVCRQDQETWPALHKDCGASV